MIFMPTESCERRSNLRRPHVDACDRLPEQTGEALAVRARDGAAESSATSTLEPYAPWRRPDSAQSPSDGCSSTS
eukprot:scaffold529_cov308-Pinguiococcus_pyrenoidosus.AAC.87